jgi:alkylhydroperoxidase family enzyme
MPRLSSVEPPYEPSIASALSRVMPPGLKPLLLFRTLMKSPRIFSKMFAGGLLDKGPLDLRQRELVIDRTTARLDCEYEWGVHIALFSERVGFSAEHINATVNCAPDASCWGPSEQSLIALVDNLVDHHTIDDATWLRIRPFFDDAQILEAIALVGYYHTISFLCRGLDLPLEAYGARFPVGSASRSDQTPGKRSLA